MEWASASSEHTDPAIAARDACGTVASLLAGGRPDVVFVFASSHTVSGLALALGVIRQRFPGAVITGATGTGVFADRPGHAHGHEPGAVLGLTAAVLPGVEVMPFRIGATQLPGPAHPFGDDPGAAWRTELGIASDERVHTVLFADPFATDVGRVLGGLDAAFRGGNHVGSLAGAARAEDVGLVCGADVTREGVVGIALRGDIDVGPVASQGCRAIGRPYVVTGLRGPYVSALDGRPVSHVVCDLYHSLGERDRALFERALVVGLECDGDRVRVDASTFVVREIEGIDRARGLLGFGTPARMYQAMQFMVRDAHAAAADLDTRLGLHREMHPVPPSGVLVFSGAAPESARDTRLVQRHLGTHPAGGLFGRGGIATTSDDRTVLHTLGSVVATFRPRTPT